ALCSLRAVVVRRESDRAVQRTEYFGVVIGPGISPSEAVLVPICISQAVDRSCVVGIDRERLFKQSPLRIVLALAGLKTLLILKRTPANNEIVRIRVGRADALRHLRLNQRIAQGVGQAYDDLILKLEQIGHVLLELLGPKMRAGIRVDELGVDPHLVLVALHRAFEHVAHAERLADLLSVDALALEDEAGVAGDDETVLDARKLSSEVLGNSVGEIILRRIAGEIGERQHHNGRMSRLRRFRQAASEQAPAAGGGQKEKGAGGGQRAPAPASRLYPTTSATRIAASLRISLNRASARAEAITKSRRLSAGFSAPGSARSKARIAPAPPGSRHPWAHGRGAWGSRRRHRNAPTISSSRRSA